MGAELKRIVVIGAGCVGRGFIGKLFCDAGHYVYFIDKDMQLTEALKSGYYVVNSGRGAQIVGPISKPEAWKDKVEINKADLIIVSVGRENLADASRLIRSNLGDSLPDIWIVENMKNADMTFASTFPSGITPKFYQGIANCIIPEVPREIRLQDASFCYGDDNGYLILPISAKRPWMENIAEFNDDWNLEWTMKWYMHCAFHLAVGLVGKKNGAEFVRDVFEDERLRKELSALESKIAWQIGKADKVTDAITAERCVDEIRSMTTPLIPDTCERLTRNLARKMQPGERMDDLRKLVSHPILDEAYGYALQLLEAQ